MTAKTIYKILPKSLWDEATEAGVFHGAGVDLADGYIHFSTESQLRETAAKHFAGQSDLVLVAIDSEVLEALATGKLVYEPSRGGDLFPHLYGPLPVSAAQWVRPMPWLESGSHQFPDLQK
jgi:uncharacterized protein (DUF952 family)